MRLTIDNLDGLGAIDYSAAVERFAPVKIDRRLNAPTTVSGMLCLQGSGLTVPVRRARVMLCSDAGSILFTGYLATEPAPVYAGMASAGAIYRMVFNAISDEWLLNKQAGATPGVGLGEHGGVLLQRLVTRLDQAAMSTGGVTAGRAVGVFVPESAATWSEHAGAVSSAAYAAYRVLNGALSLAPVGSVTHTFSDGDGTLTMSGLASSAVKELANDVTLSGGMEPTVYWNELFLGDGTTVEFDLAGQPDALGRGRQALLQDSFGEASFNRERWSLSDPGSHVSLSGDGLTLSGGNGIDGQTTLAGIDPVELGGTIVIELAGVSLAAASAGLLGGLYAGTNAQVNCFAGFNVRQVGGATVVSPLVNGVEVGNPFTMLPGHRYTLRLHLHSVELQRVKQVYYAMVDGIVESFGGGLVDAPAALVFEMRDLGESSNTPVTILYDGEAASAPAQATFVAANSVQLYGSVNSVSVTRSGSAWVQSTNGTSGTRWTRVTGAPNEGVDCVLGFGSTGKVTFLPGRAPDVDEVVQVSYRGSDRAVARVQDTASVAAEAEGGGAGTARWLGRVERPAARSSEDCASAARAVLAFSTSRAAAAKGSYVTINPVAGGDIWPGDLLTFMVNGSSMQVLIRQVTLEERGVAPEALTYHIAFANDWAEGLGLQLSEALAADALLPETAADIRAPTIAVANLQQLTVRLGTGGTSLTVDAGVNPPAGGGFEVRRRDAAFGTGVDGSASGDLVLRSPVRGFSIPRAAFQEAFFVRMYDGSVPPLYSQRSVGILTHLPISL